MAKKICYILLVFVLAFFFLGSRAVLALIVTATDDVSISARVAGDVIPPPDGGGGSGSSSGSIGIPRTATSFSGDAYPGALVSIWENGAERITVPADKAGHFQATLEEKYNDTALYTLFATDTAGNRSLLLNYPIVIYTGYVTYVSGVRFAPTIALDKTEAKYRDYLTVSGFALPNQALEVSLDGPASTVFTLTSRPSGAYSITLPLGDLPRGNYSVHVNYPGDVRTSKLVRLIIGDANIPSAETVLNIPGDCNADRIINLVDFSILAFWYGKANPPVCVDTNRDNIINLIDFSILAYYWTG